MAMQMVMNPYQFDCIVTDLIIFGDILSDLASGLVGGLGMAPGANIGDHVAIFEAVNGSAPDIAGKNIANPSAQVLAAVMMLDSIGEKEVARKIEKAVASVIEDGKYVTKDINSVNLWEPVSLQLPLLIKFRNKFCTNFCLNRALLPLLS